MGSRNVISRDVIVGTSNTLGEKEMIEKKYRIWDSEKNRFLYFSLSGMLLQPEIVFRLLKGQPNSSDAIHMWIGLEDENGKEIYEEDYVDVKYFFPGHNGTKISKERYKVAWANTKGAFHYTDGNCVGHFGMAKNFMPGHPGRQSKIEVVGNIYENPKILLGEI